MTRPPLPPFDEGSAHAKVLAAENAWNTRDPERVALAYSEDTIWRNRDEFLTGRREVVDFLTRKWERELDYVLRKDLWAWRENRVAVRFQYEWHDDSAQWWRSYGNELWEFDDDGLMRRREASINDVRIQESDRRYSARAPETAIDECPTAPPPRIETESTMNLQIMVEIEFETNEEPVAGQLPASCGPRDG